MFLSRRKLQRCQNDTVLAFLIDFSRTFQGHYITQFIRSIKIPCSFGGHQKSVPSVATYVYVQIARQPQ